MIIYVVSTGFYLQGRICTLLFPSGLTETGMPANFDKIQRKDLNTIQLPLKLTSQSFFDWRESKELLHLSLGFAPYLAGGIVHQ